MVKCCAICKAVFKRAECRSYHRFPNDTPTRTKWLQILGKESLNVSKNTLICSDHFSADSFIVKPSGLKYLRGNALPLRQEKLPKPCPRLDESLITLDNARNVEDDKYLEGKAKMCTHHNSQSPLSLSAIETPLDSIIAASSKKQLFSNSSSTISASELKNLPETTVKPKQRLITYDSLSQGTLLATGNQNHSSSTISAPEFKNLEERTSLPKHKLYFGDCSTNKMNSKARAIESWRIAKKTALMQKKKILNLQCTRRRLKSRIYNLNTLVTYFQQKYGVTESAASVIKESVSDLSSTEPFT